MSSPSGPSVVTGATGFVGRALASALGRPTALRLGVETWRDDLARTDFRDAVVFHLGARVPGEGVGEADFEWGNVERTRALAQAAAAGGARRLIFLSSIKVNGEESSTRPFRADDSPHPQDAYARSKWAAERALGDAARGTAMQAVVVRSPLVVGPGARGNLRALLGLANTPWPLPFGGIRNRRTLVAIDDLVALLIRCAGAPEAGGQTFLAGHPVALSTPEILTALRRALRRPRRLFTMPAAALETLAAPAGLGAAMRRLTRSLEIDVSQTVSALQWAPQVPIESALENMARDYCVGQTA
jgi:nucleoside-diphosphate-sugar epimerase